jgi:sarcosine oxidase/L-pipecolate oxidase
MVRLARRLWADAEAESGYRVLTPAPHLTFGPPSASLFAAVANAGAEEVDLSRRWGGAFRVPDGWVTAVSEHGGGVLSATKAMAMFQALAVKKGAVVRDNAEVVGIEKMGGPEGGVVVRTGDGEEFSGGKCVVTVGAWASKLLRSVAGVEVPTEALHTLHLYWRVKPGRERELTAKAGFPTFSSSGEPPVYGTPSLELPGLIKISCDGGPPCDPDNRDWDAGDKEVTERVARWIEVAMPGHVDAAGGPVIRQSCICSMTPDADFVIDFLGGEFGEDVVVGAGFSGHGFKMGPAVGRFLAEMAIDGKSETAEEAGVELGYYKINRFDGNPMGNYAEKDH